MFLFLCPFLCFLFLFPFYVNVSLLCNVVLFPFHVFFSHSDARHPFKNPCSSDHLLFWWTEQLHIYCDVFHPERYRNHVKEMLTQIISSAEAEMSLDLGPRATMQKNTPEDLKIAAGEKAVDESLSDMNEFGSRSIRPDSSENFSKDFLSWKPELLWLVDISVLAIEEMADIAPQSRAFHTLSTAGQHAQVLAEAFCRSQGSWCAHVCSKGNWWQQVVCHKQL